MNSDLDTNLIWLDMEMTGLNANSEHIMEIAVVPTDSQLNKLDKGFNVIIHLEDGILENMDSWCLEQHKKSGLYFRCQESNISLELAEDKCVGYCKQFANPKKSPICGNSVYQDRKFIERYMPSVENFLHYRLIDVSTVKELFYRWLPDVPAFKKNKSHTAIEDINESIDELVYYRQKLNI